MAKYSGRGLYVNLDISGVSSRVGGVTSKTVTMNAEPIDVTSDDASGWQTMLVIPGKKSLSTSIEGVAEGGDIEDFVQTMASDDISAAAVITLPNGGSLATTVVIDNYEQTGETDGSVEFSCSLQSSGAVTYTAPS